MITASRLTASLFRQSMYFRLLNQEYEFFATLYGDKRPPKIKDILHRAKRNYNSTMIDLRVSLSGGNAFTEELKQSDEKIQAIANIIEKLYVLDEETVLNLEADFEHIKVSY